MSIPKINEKKIVFVSLDWMKRYEGINDDDVPLGTAGDYQKEAKHEQYNFLNDGGKCYGYTPPSGKLHLEKICAPEEIKTDPDGYKYIENVLVVFTGKKRDGKNRRVIGFYLDAKVYNKQRPEKNPKRKIQSNNTFAGYNVVTNVENAILLPEAEREFPLPYSLSEGYGYGQWLVWYGNKDDRNVIAFRNKVVKYIEGIINEKNKCMDEDSAAIDESIINERECIEGGTTTSIKEVTKTKRNRVAREKCLKYCFKSNEHYKCKICGFDFEEKYGEKGKGIIDVHHIKSHAQVSKEIGEHEIDPETGLIPICSNCHRIIHSKKTPLEIDEIKNLIKAANRRCSKSRPK